VVTVYFLAHIVGERPPTVWSWIAAAALFAGLFGAIIRRGWLRMVCAAVAVCGLAGTVGDLIVRSARPPRPNLVVELVSPSREASSPILVKVCGQTKQGQPESPTADGRHLYVLVDHLPVAEVRRNTVLIPVTPGRHTIQVAITNTYHQQFAPSIDFTRGVTVTPGKPTRVPSCPRSR
jgi:hypothetical protein